MQLTEYVEYVFSKYKYNYIKIYVDIKHVYLYTKLYNSICAYMHIYVTSCDNMNSGIQRGISVISVIIFKSWDKEFFCSMHKQRYVNHVDFKWQL